MRDMGPRQKAMETARAAGLAGVVFAVLLAAAIVLVRLAIPEEAEAVATQAATASGQRNAVQWALDLIPFAGIFFLWFLGAVRAHVGEVEDRFLATVLLGSGLVFTATMFGGAAAAAAVLEISRSSGGTPDPAAWDLGRDLAYSLLTGYAMRMAAVFVTSLSVIGHRLGVLPRWLMILGVLTAFTLLFISSNVPWAELAFPVWSLVLSLYILGNRRTGPPDPAAP
ncbi:hypothetical protein [Streptomyces sp. NPDC014793]|uniref:hypothetical protein n=1 Tax=Streptomyces sp. NPDC014793 TaxID=3364914 RepID=UPI0036F8CC63